MYASQCCFDGHLTRDFWMQSLWDLKPKSKNLIYYLLLFLVCIEVGGHLIRHLCHPMESFYLVSRDIHKQDSSFGMESSIQIMLRLLGSIAIPWDLEECLYLYSMEKWNCDFIKLYMQSTMVFCIAWKITIRVTYSMTCTRMRKLIGDQFH